MAFRRGGARFQPKPKNADATAGDGDVAGEDAPADDVQLDLFTALDAGDETEPDGVPDDDGDAAADLEAVEPPTAAPVAAAEAIGALLADPAVAAYRLAREIETGIAPRPYQEEAIAAWAGQRGRGVIVLPTGAGKTIVALVIAARMGVRTLVVVPTIDLVRQWREQISTLLNVPIGEVGAVGGGSRLVRDLTVITYDSAAQPRRKLDGFGLLIVDEAHHLPAPAYQKIAAKVAAPFRLGLTATPERVDGGHHSLDHLIGPVAYRRTPAELAAARHIADYDERRISVKLSDEELLEYERLIGEYRRYVAIHRGSLGHPSGIFTELIRRAGRDPEARAALKAHHQARMLALNASAKVAQVAALLERHRDDKVIVFSEYTAMVDILSERLLLPAITYRTAPHERKETLRRFRDGTYSKLVTGRVLNEGVDVPDANVAIVVSGSASTREYIQRLGRILRPKASRATLYELITRKTTEGQTSRRRRRAA